MRILFTNGPPYIALGLAPAFGQIGHEADILTLSFLPYDQQMDILRKKIEEFKPDFIFTDGDPPNFNRQAVLSLSKEKNIPIIYWANEDPLWLAEFCIYCAKNADFVFTPALELVDYYRSLGKKADLLLFGCNPAFHQKVTPADDYRHDLVFVGANYDLRAEVARRMLGPLIARDYDLKVWGQWWTDPDKPYHIPPAYYGGPLAYEDLPRVYSSAKIVLGMDLDNTSITQTSVRSFEVLGCGAFYLTQYTKAHANLFEKGIHLEWASNEEEFLDLVDFYLAHNEAREKIAKKGQEYVYEHHNVTLRAKRIIDLLLS
ncbi:MAG: glycosyltransferase [Firmicutes bacterium]|nr:glycosyltransferase [Bacillota bacterium]